MKLQVTLEKEEWEYILEVLNLNETIHIKNIAINLLKIKLDEEFAHAAKK